MTDHLEDQMDGFLSWNKSKVQTNRDKGPLQVSMMIYNLVLVHG